MPVTYDCFGRAWSHRYIYSRAQSLAIQSTKGAFTLGDYFLLILLETIGHFSSSELRKPTGGTCVCLLWPRMGER